MIKLSKIFFSTLKRCYFHCKLFRDTPVDSWGLWNLHGAGKFFQKFLNKSMQRERYFGGFKYFFSRKFPTFSTTLESQLDPPINAVFAPSLINRLTYPRQNKRHSALRIKMRLNQDVRGDVKKCASGCAMATPLAYARVYPEP